LYAQQTHAESWSVALNWRVVTGLGVLRALIWETLFAWVWEKSLCSVLVSFLDLNTQQKNAWNIVSSSELLGIITAIVDKFVAQKVL